MLPPSIRQSALIAAFLLSFCSASAQELLFITNNTSLTSDEQSYKSQFEVWGYTVTTIVDTDSQSTYDAALSTSDVVFVSEEVLSSSVSYKLRETTAGVVSSEGWLDNELGFSTSDPFTSAQTLISVTDNTHDVSSGMLTGLVSVFSFTQNRVLMNGTQASGIHVLATSSSGNAVLAILEAGSSLANTYNGNSTAAGRRVRLPWGDSSFNYSSLNSTGLDLMQRALAWAASSVDSGFLLHLRLDESSGTTASDSSGSNNHGTFVNSPLLGESAIRRDGTTFDNASDFDRVSIPSSIVDGKTSLTVAWWMKTTNDGSQAILSGANSSQNNEFLIFFWNDELLSLYVDGVRRDFNIDSVANDQWTHFVLYHDRPTGDMELYINGQFYESGTHQTQSGGYEIDSGGLMIAEEQDSVGGSFATGQAFRGTLDDIRIYDYKLSDSEIAEIYGLIGRWKLDETSGTTAYDSSGTGDDGTYTGGVTLGEEGPGGTASLAAQFDGNNDYVDLPSMQHEFGDGFAASMWVKSKSNPASGSWHAFLSIANGTYNDEIWIGWRKDYGLYFYGTDQANGSNWESTNDLQDFALDTWTHAIVSIDADGYATLYQNGAATTSEEFVSLPTGVSRFFAYIADSIWDENFDGLLHDVRLYNRPLTSEEIANLSSDTSSGTGIRIQSWVEIQ